MITIIRFLNTSITSHSYLLCVYMVITFKVYSLRSFQDTTVWFTILYTRSPELFFYLKRGNVGYWVQANWAFFSKTFPLSEY